MEGGRSTSDGLVRVTVLDETGRAGPLDRWTRLVRSVLATGGAEVPAEANVVFVGVDDMAELNAEHMGGSGPTDVLSFPIDDDFAAFADDPDTGDDGGREGPFDAVMFIGDIIVCPEVAAANAPDHAGDVDSEIALLLVHGSLHLLGHDHAEAGERRFMWETERRMMADLWSPLSRDPWADDPSEPATEARQ